MMRRQGSPAATDAGYFDSHPQSKRQPAAVLTRGESNESSSSEDDENDDDDRVSPKGTGLGILNIGRSPRRTPRYKLNNSSSTSSLHNLLPRRSFTIERSSASRDASPNLTLRSKTSRPEFHRSHQRKNSKTQGLFEPTLPSVSTNVAQQQFPIMASNSNLSASQIAAQAAMQSNSMHQRQRSQTVPTPQYDAQSHNYGGRRPSRGPASPPMLSLTEASVPSSGGFGGQEYHNGLLGSRTNAATAAANVAFPRSPQPGSPGLPSPTYSTASASISQQPEKPVKAEKIKGKLFSRPGKISINKEPKEKTLPSPSKLGTYAINNLQRSAASTNSLAEAAGGSIYSLANSSTSTIRQFEGPAPEVSKGEKHKHHLFSRQKHKLGDHHLLLSSASSNSKPVDPSAPSSLYNFNLPPSPAPTTTSFAKSMSGLDLRHGGKALRDKKKEEKERETELAYQNAASDWPAPSSYGSSTMNREYGLPSTNSLGTYATSVYTVDTTVSDLGKFGLNNMTPDDAWPFLRARVLVLFENEDLRMPIEDFNKLVVTHLTRCVQRNPRNPGIIVEDLRDLLDTGFRSMEGWVKRVEHEMGREGVVKGLVEMWAVVLEKILPYMQGVFLPLDLEWEGVGTLMSPSQSQEFWSPLDPSLNNPNGSPNTLSPASKFLDIRKLVLTAYRDTVILPRFDSLKQIFSRLSLESIHAPSSIYGGDATATASMSNFTDEGTERPGTAISLDPALASFNSQSSTLLDTTSIGSRSRGISNVSFGSNQSDPNHHAPGSFSSIRGVGTASSLNITIPLESQNQLTTTSIRGLNSARDREVNAEDGKLVTDIVGKMLQCMSVLASVSSDQEVGDGPGDGGVGGVQSSFWNPAGVKGARKKEMMEELCRALKLNWLGRGRTGRNRRGFVAARMNRGGENAGGSGRGGPMASQAGDDGRGEVREQSLL